MSVSLDGIITFTLLNVEQKGKEISIQFKLDIIIFKFMFTKKTSLIIPFLTHFDQMKALVLKDIKITSKFNFITYLREVFKKKNGKKAVRLTAWVDPPSPSPEAVRKM